MKTLKQEIAFIIGYGILCLFIFLGVYAVAEAKDIKCADVEINWLSVAEITKRTNGDGLAYINTVVIYDKFTNGKYTGIKNKKTVWRFYVPTDLSEYWNEWGFEHELGHYIFDHLKISERNNWKKRFFKKTSTCYDWYGKTSYDECFSQDFVAYSFGELPKDKSFQYSFISKLVDQMEKRERTFPIDECLKGL